MELNIGADFSLDPAGRYYADGPASGEQFRELVLKPLLEKLGKSEKLLITLDDGVESYGSSFISEGFGGIVKYGYMSSEELLSRLEFIYSDEDYEFFEGRIREIVSEAKFGSKEYLSSKADR